MIMKVNHCLDLLPNQLVTIYNESPVLHISKEPWACVRPLVPRQRTAGFQTAVCNGVWREKNAKPQYKGLSACIPAH